MWTPGKRLQDSWDSHVCACTIAITVTDVGAVTSWRKLRSENSQTQKPTRLKMEPVKWQKSGPWWWLESPNSSCMSKSVLVFLYTCHFSWSHSNCSESGVIANLAFSQWGVEAEWMQILGLKEMRISLRREVSPWHPQTVIAKVSGPPDADWKGEKCWRLRSTSHRFQLCLENWH